LVLKRRRAAQRAALRFGFFSMLACRVKSGARRLRLVLWQNRRERKAKAESQPMIG
jgi:hypothetical protein